MTATPSSTRHPPRPRRWAVLAAYAAVAGVSQMLWLNFAPLLSQIQARYGVSELVASFLVLVFPLLYVVLSVPAGALVDRRGYRFGVGVGAGGMAVFAVVRIFDAAFWPLLVGQIGIAAVQPYVLNGVSKLVADWFDEEQGALATGLATLGMFVGMAVGMAATPPLVGAMGLRSAMAIFAGVTIVSAGVFLLVLRPGDERRGADTSSASGFGPLLRDRQIVLLLLLSFLGLGVFNGLTTWLEPIVLPHGFDSDHAGLAGGAILVGGMVGAVAIPALSDALRRRKPFVILSVAGALVTLYPLCTTSQYGVLLGLGALHGFFFLPAFALLLDACSQIAGVRAAGAATSLVMLAGNTGGVVVVLAMGAIKGSGTDFQPAVVLMEALLGVALALSLRVKEPFSGRAPA